ncbi:MAG: GIY-YIG nuclease family protein [Bacteroidetes bacterium]|nr:GIY-YIG nuclease family protein [Bacteroidota bacterium]
MTKPYSIRIFLPTGDPDGIRTIEKSNWSGIGLVFPRSLFAEARARKELDRTGVYVLIGPPEDNGIRKIYIGEGDPIKGRLESHAKSKEFWTSCVAYTSKDENLNKAHVQYLESRLYALAAEGKRCLLDNGNVPQLPSMSEADKADAEGFLAELLLCLPVLGVTMFSPVVARDERSSALRYTIASRGITAYGTEVPQGFVVERGSTSSATEVASCHTYLREIRTALIDNGVLVRNGTSLEFTQDYVFTSPSTAAGVVLGRSANGREEWKTAKGRTLKSIQDGEVSK